MAQDRLEGRNLIPSATGPAGPIPHPAYCTPQCYAKGKRKLSGSCKCKGCRGGAHGRGKKYAFDHGYTQLFRSGIVEYAFSHFYGPPIGFHSDLIKGQEVEQAIVHCYEDGIGRFRREGRTGILYVAFSMAGIQDKQIFSVSRIWYPRESGIRENTFTSPEVMVDLSEVEERPYPRTLRPLVDTFWQLDGREGTPFTPNEEWNPFGGYD